MEEKINVVEEAKVEVEEKGKKKISKKVWALGAGALALVIGVVALAVKANKDGDDSEDSGVIDVDYTEVNTDSSDTIEE